MPLPAGSELTVYRLIQEALTNVSKYARARSVHVSLALRNDRVDASLPSLVTQSA